MLFMRGGGDLCAGKRNRQMCKSDAMLSIIIPVYNTEKYLPRAITSVLAQTHKEFEVIVVNDGSEGDCDKIVEKYSSRDSRIRLISKAKNEGLFKARVSGVLIAAGEYITFLDSDDHVSIDFYRVMLESAAIHEADIVVGKTVMEHGKRRYVKTLQDNLFTGDVLDAEQIKKSFFGGQGQIHLWHNIWNKIYSKQLWTKCLPYFQRLDQHLVMTEDIAFSFPLLYFAKKMTFVRTECYYYVQHGKSSISLKGMNYARMLKNIQDVATAFMFVDSFLADVGAADYLRNDFNEFRQMYYRMYRNLVFTFLRAKFSPEERALLDSALTAVASDYASEFAHDDSPWSWPADDYFFEQMTTECGAPRLSAIKEQIADPTCEYVSFALFDTLVVKPFLAPQDLFTLLEGKRGDLPPFNEGLHSVRLAAEIEAMAACATQEGNCETITLDDIYRNVALRLGVSKETAEILRKEERKLELRFCRKRETAKELFDFALAMKKKVLIVSDTYLDAELVEAILERNGYAGHKKSFLSSERKVAKKSGALFQVMLDELGVEGGRVCHIGDSLESDCIIPAKFGINAFFFPGPAALMCNAVMESKTNRCLSIGECTYGPIGDTSVLARSIGYRTAQALAANRYFDNPYRNFNQESDFNADPFFIGYYPLAMHHLGLATWIIRKCRTNQYKRIHFLGRDGYLPMKFFEKMAPHFQCETTADLLHGSRRALMPAYFTASADFFDSRMNAQCRSLRTPFDMLKLLNFCTRRISDAEMRKLMAQNGFVSDVAFDRDEEYRRFISFFLDELYDANQHAKARNLLAEYFSDNIDDSDVFFDIGYNGSTPTALSKLSNRQVNMLYVHVGGDEAANAQRRHGFDLDCFYDFTPAMTGSLREHLMSEMVPSCIGFENADGSPLPRIENETRKCQDAMIVEAVQRGALEFLNDYLETFADFIEYLPFRCYEISMPFEAFLRIPKDNDIKIFSASYFNDDLYKRHNIYDAMKARIARLELRFDSQGLSPSIDVIWEFVKNRSWFTQFMVYLFLDRGILERYFSEISTRYSPIPRFFVKIMALLMRLSKK